MNGRVPTGRGISMLPSASCSRGFERLESSIPMPSRKYWYSITCSFQLSAFRGDTVRFMSGASSSSDTAGTASWHIESRVCGRLNKPFRMCGHVWAVPCRSRRGCTRSIQVSIHHPRENELMGWQGYNIPFCKSTGRKTHPLFKFCMPPVLLSICSTFLVIIVLVSRATDRQITNLTLTCTKWGGELLGF